MHAEAFRPAAGIPVLAIRRDKQRCLFMDKHANFKPIV